MHLVLLALLQTLPSQRFPPVDHPGGDPKLFATITAACPAPTSDRGKLLSLADRYNDSLRQHGGDAALWFATACVRADLLVAGAVAREGLAMPLGASWQVGSVNALVRALALRPADARAADLLATLALDDIDLPGLSSVKGALDRARAAGAASPAVFRACSEFAWRAHDTTATRTCAMVSLAAGVDSTWQLIRLARVRFANADTFGGNAFFIRAVGAARDSASKLEVEWHLQWFLSPAEQSEWEHLAESERAAWVRNRLAARDVRDGQPAGARLAEHFSRLDYVENHFRMSVPRRIAAGLRGGPATQEAPGMCGNEAICAEPGGVWAVEWREYRRWQTDFDDRGVVWMRFGRPDRLIPWVCPYAGCATVREAWVYELDGRELLLNFENEAFDGSESATRLVTGVLGSYFCDIDSQRCRLTSLSQAEAATLTQRYATRPSSPMVKPEEIQHLVTSDREAISVATTTDDNAPRGRRPIGTVARLHRLWDPATGLPLALVTYAIRMKDLKASPGTANAEIDVELAVRQWDAAAGERRDAAFRQRIVPGNKDEASWAGFLLLPSTSDVSAWSFMVTQSDQRLGRAFDDHGTPLSHGEIALSDIVLGSTGESFRWSAGGNPIAIAPFDAIARADTLHLYYQVRSRQAMSAHTVVALYDVGNARRDQRPALQVAFATSLRAGISEEARTLDVSRLRTGTYRLELRLEDDKHQTIVARSTTVTLR